MNDPIHEPIEAPNHKLPKYGESIPVKNHAMTEDELIAALKVKGIERAITTAKAKWYDNMRKTKRSDIMTEIEKALPPDQKSLSEAKLERLARIDKRYLEFINECEIALKASVQAESDWQILLAQKTFINGARSVQWY
jgi:hypothetical protein